MTYDDENIGRLVREAADSWAMPPVRLDQPTWRDRVHGRPASAGLGARVLRLIGSATGLAVALMVVVALVAVFLNTRAPNGPVSRPSTAAVASPSSGASPSAAQSVMPTDALPSVTHAVVSLELGSFAIADLVNGGRESSFVSADYGSVVRRAADGTIFCICLDYSGTQNGQPTQVAVDFRRYTSEGDPIDTRAIATFSGSADPRDGTGVPEQPSNVIAAVSFGTNEKTAYVGFSERVHPVWKTGLLKIDTATGNVVDEIDLPDSADGETTTGRVTDAPRVAGVVGDDLIIGRHFYTWSPRTSTQPGYFPSLEVFSVGSEVNDIAVDGCGVSLERAGALSDGGMWLACLNQMSQVVVERLDATGELIERLPINTQFGDGALTALSPDERFLYAWNPVDAELTRVELDSGDVTTIDGAPRSSADVLDQLSELLVPSARAKILLSAGLALSADGSHAYGLGVVNPSSPQGSGSTGVYAFDLSGPMTAQQWQPTADFTSVAVSADGRWVYAAGQPGVDADGNMANTYASVTVYDAQTGDVVSYHDDYGNTLVTFPEQVLR